MCKYCREGTFEELKFEDLGRIDPRVGCQELVDCPPPEDFEPCDEPASWRLLSQNTDEHLCTDHKAAFLEQYLEDQVDDPQEVASFERQSLRRIGAGDRCDAYDSATRPTCAKPARWVSIVTWELLRCDEHRDAPPHNSSRARAEYA